MLLVQFQWTAQMFSFPGDGLHPSRADSSTELQIHLTSEFDQTPPRSTSDPVGRGSSEKMEDSQEVQEGGENMDQTTEPPNGGRGRQETMHGNCIELPKHDSTSCVRSSTIRSWGMHVSLTTSRLLWKYLRPQSVVISII